MAKIALLPRRGVLAITGEDRFAFLQGLVSNDVDEARMGRAVWAALLTPQGKWLSDFFIFSDMDRLLLDCEAGQLDMIRQRLSRYRLRSKATLADAGLLVFAGWDGAPNPGGVSAADPRLPEAGWRALREAPIPVSASEAEYDKHRLSLGLPDGSRDMESEKSVLLEAGFDELNGVSWTKGCYLGQELTARTKYRGLVKRRLVPVRIDGPVPAPGAAITLEGREVGTMRSARSPAGMAVVRLEALTHSLACEAARLTPVVPSWMNLVSQ